jgi:hypothetical protein
MRRPLATFAIAALIAATHPSAGVAEVLATPIDQGVHVALPPGAQNVMIGNPAIADVTVLDARNALVMGRAYGTTNLIVLDGRGRMLVDRQVVVSSAEVAQVTFYHGPNAGDHPGAHIETYACASRCQRVPMPGEMQNDYQNYAVAYDNASKAGSEARKGAATSSGTP